MLVGSHARGQAPHSSDVDLVLLVEDSRVYWGDFSWLRRFGTALRQELEDWGKVQSVRVFYQGGLEVEFGITGLDWGSDPGDEGTAQVIRQGVRAVYARAAGHRPRGSPLPD